MLIVDAIYSSGSIRVIDIINGKTKRLTPKEIKQYIKNNHNIFGVELDGNGNIWGCLTYKALKFPSYDEAREYMQELDNMNSCMFFENIQGYPWIFVPTNNYIDDPCDFVVYTYNKYQGTTYVAKRTKENQGYTKDQAQAKRFTEEDAIKKARSMTLRSRSGNTWTWARLAITV